MFEADNLQIAYGPVHAVKGVSLSASYGEIVSVLGANGAGKSSLLKALAGFLAPSSGSVVLDGDTINEIDVAGRVRKGVALVQEGRQVWSSLSVEEHLRLGWYTKRKDSGEESFEDVRDFIFELFPRVAERRQQFVGTLSGGEQQMVVIGRALMSRPRVLLLDEPTLGLAPVIIDKIGETLDEMRSSDLAVIVAEQDASFALEVADRAYVLEVGECRMSGPADELAESAELISAYLGFGDASSGTPDESGEQAAAAEVPSDGGPSSE